MKKSEDGGETCSSMEFLRKERGFASVAGVYDVVRKRVVVIYLYHPSKDPDFNVTYWEQFSDDDGKTWSSPFDVTEKIRGCNPYAPKGMVVNSAGSKVFTNHSRIIYAGHRVGSNGRSDVYV
eukprot:TRINITY_DN575_c0_g1_i2.p1 TRINITY_DN575_c0_g1~~TRINITY_DN575_c0_g1_i2.p1  ORF type:complete len:122 (+),score=22.90 TRINITY_DN575_c0_g1_i2:237-602(+)